uniref:Uncharacterized protein n=1 Tax=Graphocephala atropunctata TaxID=36148 RepID=A0A1B6KAX7_9HEMI
MKKTTTKGDIKKLKALLKKKKTHFLLHTRLTTSSYAILHKDTHVTPEHPLSSHSSWSGSSGRWEGSRNHRKGERNPHRNRRNRTVVVPALARGPVPPWGNTGPAQEVPVADSSRSTAMSHQ